MANPVLSRPDTFTPATGYAGPSYAACTAYAPQTSAQQPYGQYAYNPAQQPYVAPPLDYSQAAPTTQRTMTYDDVLTKTAITLGLLALVAAVSYTYVPLQALLPAAIFCGLVSFIVPLVAAFRRNTGPVFNIAYAVFEGVFIGAISAVFELTEYHGIVLQAVIATLVTSGLTLAAFHFTGFRTTPKMTKMLCIALLGMCGVGLVNLVARLAGYNLGLFPAAGESVGGLAWIAALAGVGLAVWSLLDDFTYIERGVQMGAPVQQSWTAAWGLTVTLVYLYINLLRILAYFNRR
jgi:uncharacterized YccA/Bax inhibitor family protein